MALRPGPRAAGCSCATAHGQQRAREPRARCNRQAPAQEARVGPGEDRSLGAAEQLEPLITGIGSGRASRGLGALSHFPRNQIPRAGGRGGGCASLRPGAGQHWAEAKPRTHGGGARAAGAGSCWLVHRFVGLGEGTRVSVPQFSFSIKWNGTAPFPCIWLLAKQVLSLWKTLQIISAGPKRHGPYL